MNDYQIDDLKSVLERIHEVVPGFECSIEFTGHYEATMNGNLPTVICDLSYQDIPSQVILPIANLRITLAADLRARFAKLMTKALENLIAEAETCPITK
jgi:hypothetical protein